MKKSTLLLVSFFLSLSFHLHAANFLRFCQLQERENNSPKIRHTVNVLLDLAQTNDCELAFKRLNEMSHFYLDSKGIESLLPFYGLNNVEFLDLSKNNIHSLWGLEKTSSLKFLFLSQNSISNLIPLNLLEDILVIDLSHNEVKDILPLKNHSNLEFLTLKLEHNPVFNNDDEMGSLHGLQWYRGVSTRGLVYDLNFDSTDDTMDFFFRLVDRGDYTTFKQFSNYVILSEQAFDDLCLKGKKFFLAAKNSDLIVGEIFHSMKSDRSIFSNYAELRSAMIKTIEFFILDPKTPSFNQRSIDYLKKYLVEKISSNPILREPIYLYNLCESWSKRVVDSGIPLGMVSGF